MATTPTVRFRSAVNGRASLSHRQINRNESRKCLRAAATPYKAYSQVIDRYLMLFLVQQDLGVQLQRAMNTERYDLVQQVQKRKAEVRSAVVILHSGTFSSNAFPSTPRCAEN